MQNVVVVYAIQSNKSDLIIKNAFNKMGEYSLFLNESLDIFYDTYIEESLNVGNLEGMMDDCGWKIGKQKIKFVHIVYHKR